MRVFCFWLLKISWSSSSYEVFEKFPYVSHSVDCRRASMTQFPVDKCLFRILAIDVRTQRFWAAGRTRTANINISSLPRSLHIAHLKNSIRHTHEKLNILDRESKSQPAQDQLRKMDLVMVKPAKIKTNYSPSITFLISNRFLSLKIILTSG